MCLDVSGLSEGWWRCGIRFGGVLDPHVWCSEKVVWWKMMKKMVFSSVVYEENDSFGTVRDCSCFSQTREKIHKSPCTARGD